MVNFSKQIHLEDRTRKKDTLFQEQELLHPAMRFRHYPARPRRGRPQSLLERLKQLLTRRQKASYRQKSRRLALARRRQEMIRENRRLEREKRIQREKRIMKEQLIKFLALEASAALKDGMTKIQTGHLKEGLEDIRATGREGALGNELASASSKVSQGAKNLEKATGKEFDKTMYQILRDHSVPADSIYAQKDKEKGDKNLEERITRQSTAQEMVAHHLKHHAGR